MYKSVIYKGEEVLGEVEVYPQEHDGEEEQMVEDEKNKKYIGKKWMGEILKLGVRISHFSPSSERCPPLAVLHTITRTGVCVKMNSLPNNDLGSPLDLLHSHCVQDNKTAVMSLGDEELHLVAMYSRNSERQHPCFWGFIVTAGLYNSCLVMLNLRCLGIVFDLDETLVVANTMRSFEDKIEALQRKISCEVDPQRISGMVSEVKRYQDDKMILKQYVDNDQVIDNGKAVKATSEVVAALSDNHQTIVRPLIRLPERNIILTRINPQIRDTSVLVRLRPAWEDLRSYLMARGRKRFEVYVCTMAERDYALEMWRLLDSESSLINSNELLNRIVCVKSGLRKSLFHVFQEGICHPKMALVIDDRLKVWDEKDQSRVHVVPAFAPYYAPLAEANNTTPVLCVARNVACNVRGGFFKEFDEVLLQKIPNILYEDDIGSIPAPPDVCNYLVPDDDTSVSNGIKDAVTFDGMTDAEIERRLKEAASATSAVPSNLASAVQSAIPSLDPRLISTLQFTLAAAGNPIPAPTSQSSAIPYASLQVPQSQTAAVSKPMSQASHPHPEPNFQSSPVREEGEVPESELDPDTRRRLLILQHGQDFRDNSHPVRPPLKMALPRSQSQGVWSPMEEEMSPRQPNRASARDYSVDSDPLHLDKHRSQHSSFYPVVDNAIPSERLLHENQRFSKEAPFISSRARVNEVSNLRSFSGEDLPSTRASSHIREGEFDSDPTVRSVQFISDTPVGVLQEIAGKCGTKVEFKPALVASRDLQFSVEIWFAGEKLGKGIGRTRREAQRQAAEGSIKNLAGIYLSRSKSDSGAAKGDLSRYCDGSENSLTGDVGSVGSYPSLKDEPTSFLAGQQVSGLNDQHRSEGSRRSVVALKEFCMMEGLGVNFIAQSPLNSMQQEEVHAKVEVDGRIVAEGVGSTWDEAKTQAAEKALGSLRTMFGSFTNKRQGSPRSMQGIPPNKRPKPEFSRSFHRGSSALRYSKNIPPVP